MRAWCVHFVLRVFIATSHSATTTRTCAAVSVVPNRVSIGSTVSASCCTPARRYVANEARALTHGWLVAGCAITAWCSMHCAAIRSPLGTAPRPPLPSFGHQCSNSKVDMACATLSFDKSLKYYFCLHSPSPPRRRLVRISAFAPALAAHIHIRVRSVIF